MSLENHDKLKDWYRELSSPLKRFLTQRAGRSSADIDDIAQEVFLRLLRYDRAGIVEHPAAYLYKIAAHVSSEWSARSNRAQPHSADWLEELVEPVTPLSTTEADSNKQKVRDALALLPPRTREILRLLHAEELGYNQIAERLGLTRRIVKRVVVESYAALRLTLGAHVSAGKDWRMVP